MKVIIAITFCCNNLWKCKVVALENPGKLRKFFLLLFDQPGSVLKRSDTQVIPKKGTGFFGKIQQKRLILVCHAGNN